MANNYNAYETLYNYMNNLWGQVQSNSAYGSQTSQIGSTRQVSSGQSFSDAFRNTSQQLGVPVSMDSIFEEAARLYNVPAALLKAMGKAESGFNADAVSPAGAQGVMQLMPATARALGVDDPFDARSNIMGGAKYIAEKLNDYDGDIELALAAYNAGSGNVRKYGGVPPFTETQNYIKRILGYMGMDLTTGKTVMEKAGTDSSGLFGTETLGSGIETPFDSMDMTEVMSQYFLAKMQLQLQDKMDMLGRSISEESEEEEENNRVERKN